MERFEKTALIFICIFIVWAVLFVAAGLLDTEHCKLNGAEYEMTTLTLQGYCSIDGVIIPAAEVGK